MLNEFAMEVEIPNTQVDKFTKFFNGKVLAMEIDKLHGIEPALSRWHDVKLTGLIKTMGLSSSCVQSKSSVEALKKRIDFLESCGANRQKELAAISELARAMSNEVSERFNMLIHRIDVKVYEKCGSKFDYIENKIISTVRQELSFISTPLPFEHPPKGYEPRVSSTSPFKIVPGTPMKLDFLDDLESRKSYGYSKTVATPIETVAPEILPAKTIIKVRYVESATDDSPVGHLRKDAKKIGRKPLHVKLSDADADSEGGGENGHITQDSEIDSALSSNNMCIRPTEPRRNKKLQSPKDINQDSNLGNALGTETNALEMSGFRT